ncbi:hypothetical protein CEF21_12160 [Bacillus sp. FJAT-42376]|nr:hypothetical protein CEF21_12160 [Bacillus sp. FJAT-42376]
MPFSCLSSICSYYGKAEGISYRHIQKSIENRLQAKKWIAGTWAEFCKWLSKMYECLRPTFRSALLKPDVDFSTF